MFAVIKTGGKQFRVAPNDTLRVEKLAGAPGETVELTSVLMVGGEEGVRVGAPLVEGATVAAEVLEQTRGPKVIVFKRKRRKNHRRRAGHRQALTLLRVTEILTEGRKPAKAKPAAETPAKPAAKRAAAKKGAAQKAPARKAPARKAPAKKAAPKAGAQAAETAKKGSAKTASKKRE